MQRRERDARIVAVCEGRGNQVGLAVANANNPTDMAIVQISDAKSFSRTMATLDRFDPVDVLIADNYAGSYLSQRIEELGHDDEGGDESADLVASTARWRVVRVARRFFNDTAGHEFLVQYSPRAIMTQAQAAQAYLALASLAALAKYLEHIQSVYFVPHGVRIRLESLAGHMFIDVSTSKHLELVRNRRSGDEQGTLLSVLDRCCTSVGRRQLRGCILAPFADAEEIRRRHEAIEELLVGADTAAAARQALKALTNWDFVVNQLAAVPKSATPRTCATMARAMCALRANLLSASALGRRLRSSCESAALAALAHALDGGGAREVADLLGELVDDEAEGKRKAAALPAEGVFALRDGCDPLLDVARRTLLEAHEDLQGLCAAYAEEHPELAPTLKWSSARGFHLSILPPNSAPLPGLFLQPVRQKRRIVCTTAAVQSISASFREALAQVHQLTAQAFGRLREEVVPHIHAIYDAVDATATLDVLQSLAAAAAAAGSAGGKAFTRPALHAGGLAMAAQAARHPMVERACEARGQGYVPNDLYLSSAANVRLVTGPNAAGKSTFLKQTAVLAIMAQTGSFVPAAFASLRLFDRVCCRVGTEDELASNASTFSLEMAELTAILRELTPASLVVLDELGRGTSHAEGFAVAWAALEALKSSQAFVLLATHFHGLAALAEAYPNVDVFHLRVGEGDGPEAGSEAAQGGSGAIAFAYTVCDGLAPPAPMHGIRLAAQCGMPADVVELAAKLRPAIAAKLEPPVIAWSDPEAFRDTVAHYNVAKQVLPLAGASVDSRGRRLFLERVRRRVQVGAE